jgi:hypothetical protein
MIFNGILATAGDDDNVLNSRGDAFFDGVLNERFVYNGQHFFRLSFRGGKKTGAEPCGGKHGFANSGITRH